MEVLSSGNRKSAVETSLSIPLTWSDILVQNEEDGGWKSAGEAAVVREDG